MARGAIRSSQLRREGTTLGHRTEACVSPWGLEGAAVRVLREESQSPNHTRPPVRSEDGAAEPSPSPGAHVTVPSGSRAACEDDTAVIGLSVSFRSCGREDPGSAASSPRSSDGLAEARPLHVRRAAPQRLPSFASGLRDSPAEPLFPKTGACAHGCPGSLIGSSAQGSAATPVPSTRDRPGTRKPPATLGTGRGVNSRKAFPCISA